MATRYERVKQADGYYHTRPVKDGNRAPAPTAIQSADVQELIRKIINDTMEEKDRTVTIRIDPDGAISVSVYPTIN